MSAFCVELMTVSLFRNHKLSLERNLSIIKNSITLKILRDLINHFFEQELTFFTTGFVLFMF